MRVDLWERFRGLGPSTTVHVATVDAHNPDGTSSLSSPEGYPLRAIGRSVAVGARAYVQGGRVIGEAADLAPVNLTV